MKNGYYITIKGDRVIKVILEPSHTINVSSMNIIELVIPDGVNSIYCGNNKLIELICPDSVVYINCRFNYIDELIIPDNCRVNCDPHVKLINKTMYNRSNRLKAILK